MLTNYDYTIDYTNDADGAAETWGTEAGYGIISASQMLAWVEANCGVACPGETGETGALRHGVGRFRYRPPLYQMVRLIGVTPSVALEHVRPSLSTILTIWSVREWCSVRLEKASAGGLCYLGPVRSFACHVAAPAVPSPIPGNN